MRILVSITTAGASKRDWRERIEESARLDIRQMALFLTGLDAAERVECYTLLQTIQPFHGFTIPFVHATCDMEEWEYHLLEQEFGCVRFNLHPTTTLPLLHTLSKHVRRSIYIENNRALYKSSLRGFAGICLDISHLESDRRAGRIENYARITALIKEYGVGANHISAITSKPIIHADGYISYAPHRLGSLSDLNYLTQYSQRFFAKMIAVELNNPLAEQIEIKHYIKSLLTTPRRHRQLLPELPGFAPVETPAIA